MRRCVVLCAFLIAACREVTGPTALLDNQFTLAPGEIAHIANTRTDIAFDGVEGDSRCPADVLCIQGGDARVSIRVIDHKDTVAFELHTGDLKPVMHDGFVVALIDLSPYPFSSRTITPGDYRATFRVTRD